MTHTYKVTGMTCSSCEAKVKSSLLTLPNVTEAEVSKDSQTAIITMDKHIPLATFQNALDKKYSIAAMYDIVAKKIKAWGFIYPFIELALGFAYATGFQPFVTNIVTVIVMTVSMIGVLQSVLNKRKIRCACLGAVFNLPMSTVTIIEDALMIAMSATALAIMWG